MLDLLELVRADQCQCACSLFGRFVESRREALQKGSAVQKTCGRVDLGVGGEISRRLGNGFRGLGVNTQPDGRFAVVYGRFHVELNGSEFAGARQRIDRQGIAFPLATAASAERLFDVLLAAFGKEIHQRTDGGVGIGVGEQVGPGLIGFDHDAFLHDRNGIGGTRQQRLHFAAILFGRQTSLSLEVIWRRFPG